MTMMMNEIRVPGCDAPSPPPVYMNNSGTGYICRCLVCARCGHHTGNNTQGHYWKFCRRQLKSTKFHFCCPNDCELEEKQ